MAKLLKMLWEYMDLTVLPFFETWSAHIFGGWQRVCWCTNEAFNQASPTKEFWENCPQKTVGHIYGKNEGWAYLLKLLYSMIPPPPTISTILLDHVSNLWMTPISFLHLSSEPSVILKLSVLDIWRFRSRYPVPWESSADEVLSWVSFNLLRLWRTALTFFFPSLV